MTPIETEIELEKLHAAAFAWALACCGRRREEAEDVLQTTYLKIFDGRARFAGLSSFRTFLFGVIRRTAAENRRKGALPLLLFGSGRERERSSEESGPSGPEEQLAIATALARLPRRQREVLELVFSFGLTVEEAAATLSLSVGSARVHYARGKRRLASLLGGGDPG